MKPIVEIFSQGEEVVTGKTVDTNAAWLAQQLVQMGFRVKRHTAVGDNLGDLKQLLQEIATRADCCICSGGLGPTQDDLTAQAVAEAFDRPLQLDLEALATIQQYFARRGRRMVEANMKQAYFPQGAQRIDNHWGTAPGFSLHQQRCRFFFVPGVPYEMRQLFNKNIHHTLLQHFTLQPDTLVTIRSIGIGESDIQHKLNELQLPDSVQLGFCTGADENQTKLVFPSGFAAHRLTETVMQTAQCIGDYVFAIDGLNQRQGGLVDVIDTLMTQKQYSLAVLETASQGLIAAKCVGCRWLLSSSYRHSLTDIGTDLAVPINPGELAGTARACAEQLRRKEGCDMVLVQLYSGSAEQYRDKNQTIAVAFCLLTPDGMHRYHYTAGGSAQRKQNQTALHALDLLRRYLQNKCH